MDGTGDSNVWCRSATQGVFQRDRFLRTYVPGMTTRPSTPFRSITKSLRSPIESCSIDTVIYEGL
jgi:hypothetical protein